MDIIDIHKAFDFINKRTVFTNITDPITYEIPKISGIHHKEYGKTIKEVYPNTLNYIIYNLHNIDYSFLIESIMALFYYWKFRKKNNSKLIEVYQEIIKHFTSINDTYKFDYNKGECIYLIRIYIGSERLYKIGRTSDFNERTKNLEYNIKAKYPYISVGIKPLQVIYTANSNEVEKQILSQVQKVNEKKNSFYFNGHTESFKNIETVDIFNKFIEGVGA